MAHPRKKKRTHPGHANERSAAPAVAAVNRGPKSMVIRIGAGEVGAGISQLAKDLRRLMEPETASRLKERRSNKLRDYVTMTGPLGVSHLLLLSRSGLGNTNLRIALSPRGPTLNFRIQTYSLAKDIQRIQRHPCTRPQDFLAPPLLVMNNFTDVDHSKTPGRVHSTVPKHLETLVTSIFQSVFPPIKPNDTPLSSIRRVVLLTRHYQESSDAGNFVISLRHYMISSKPVNVSRGARQFSTAKNILRKGKKQERTIPRLNRLDDIADLFLDPASSIVDHTAHSESEIETEAEVDILLTETKRIPSHHQNANEQAEERPWGDREDVGAEKRSIKLVEVGPRLQLRMTKVEEDLCGGRVMWHDYLEKTPGELQALDLEWESRRAKKAERRKTQSENVAKKRQTDARYLQKIREVDTSKSMDENDESESDHTIHSQSETEASDGDAV